MPSAKHSEDGPSKAAVRYERVVKSKYQCHARQYLPVKIMFLIYPASLVVIKANA